MTRIFQTAFVLLTVLPVFGCSSVPANNSERIPASSEAPFTSGKMGLAPSITSADFDGDGIVDLIVVTGGSDMSLTKGTIRFFKGLGSGKFSANAVVVDQLDYNATDGGVSVTSGDFNNDTCPDIAVASIDKTIAAAGHILIYLGNCKGQFHRAVSRE